MSKTRIPKRQRELEERIVGSIMGGANSDSFGCSATCRCSKHRQIWRVARRIATMRIEPVES